MIASLAFMLSHSKDRSRPLGTVGPLKTSLMIASWSLSLSNPWGKGPSLAADLPRRAANASSPCADEGTYDAHRGLRVLYRVGAWRLVNL